MRRIFVDTSAFAALADRNDDRHQAARKFNQSIKNIKLVTSNYVLDELYTLLLMNIGYLKTVQFKERLDFMRERKLMEMIWISESLETHTWKTFEQFNQDKQWSFTDCSSFVVMQQEKMSEVFTFDHHFTQMGFQQLPSAQD